MSAAKEHAATYTQLHRHLEGHAFVVVSLVIAIENEVNPPTHRFTSTGMKTYPGIHLLFLKLYRVWSTSKWYWTHLLEKTM